MRAFFKNFQGASFINRPLFTMFMSDKDKEKTIVAPAEKKDSAPQPKAKIKKLVKKRWYQIIAPKFLNELIVGEVYAGDAKDVVNRTFHVNLAAVTGESQHQQMHATFTVTHVNGDKLFTVLKGLKIIPSAVKRLIRRKKPRVDISFVVQTSDGFNVRIKPFGVARGGASGGVMAKLRNEVKKLLTETAKAASYDDLLLSVLNNTLQKTVLESSKKIYPLGRFEIRWIERV